MTIKDTIKRKLVNTPLLGKIVILIYMCIHSTERELANNLYKNFFFNNNYLSQDNVIYDVFKCVLMYNIAIEEYYRYDFVSKSDYARGLIISERNRRIYFRNVVNNNDYWKLYSDKYATYLKFSQYYHREAIEIKDREDYELFCSFVKKHDKIIVKPINNYSGKGIFIVDFKSQSVNIQDVFNKILRVGTSVVEECIKQSIEMGGFYEKSVNTVRYVTFFQEGKLTKMFALLRMGQGGCEVDNVGAGGICASIDLDTGVVTSPGRKYDGSTYLFHPDSHKQILGAIIPQWLELTKLIEQLVTIYPQQKWTGWDLFLDDKGWGVIEANFSPSFMGIQTTLNSGIKPIVDDILGNLNLS